VEADSLNAFKNRLDKYWTNQDVVYLFVLNVSYVTLFEMRVERNSCAHNITLDCIGWCTPSPQRKFCHTTPGVDDDCT